MEISRVLESFGSHMNRAHPPEKTIDTWGQNGVSTPTPSARSPDKQSAGKIVRIKKGLNQKQIFIPYLGVGRSPPSDLEEAQNW